ncbi:hypothetical protein C2845_PM01G11570 [Panicum miliaceum]|uniref:Uncharacterized protein n=1 Tax=Panicum miliaceum TaxID=4540 RepID=A0A3L6TMS1_PANMI|nr:hypothetical protein C2845_PM01G11570 [Panicum miliaceum]
MRRNVKQRTLARTQVQVGSAAPWIDPDLSKNAQVEWYTTTSRANTWPIFYTTIRTLFLHATHPQHDPQA